MATMMAGCGGGGSSSSGAATATGLLVDSAVQGVSYVSGGQSGVTGADGSFTYEVGNTITFSIGNIVLGNVGIEPKGIMTPLDLAGAVDATDTAVVNLAIFLMTLDSDQDPSNGIEIEPDVRTAAASPSVTQIDFSTANVGDLTSLLGVLTSSPVVSAEDALSHVSGSILNLYAGSYTGTFAGDDSGTWSATIDSDGVITGTFTGTSSGTLSGSIDTSGSMFFSTSGNTSEGTVFSGTIDISTGSAAGTWSDDEDSGTYAGNKISSIIGSWYSGTGPDDLVVLTFFEDGTYMFSQDGNAAQHGDEGQDGMERGTYAWDSSTGAFTASPAVDTSGDWGLSHPQGTVTVQINGNVMTMTDSVEGIYTAVRVTNGSGSIVGSWYNGSTSQTNNLVILTFFEDGTYMFSQDGNAAQHGDGGQDGMERGTYAWDSGTGAFTATPAVDTSGEWGLSHPDGSVTVQVNGNNMTMTDSGGGITATRILP